MMFYKRLLTPKEYERLLKTARETVARDYLKQIKKQKYLWFRNKLST